ncbi:glycosyltransferase family 2 protein [Clostridium perfringens]
MGKFVSIIIPVYNEQKYIKKCIESLIKIEYPKNLLEIIFVDGMSCDDTRKIINEFIKKNNFIKLIDNEKKIAPIAMNLGIEAARGDLIMRMDAHSSYPKDYVTKLVAWKEKLNAANVGAICKTDVVNKNKKSVAIIKVLSNKFGIGNGLFRIGVTEPTNVDTVPFGLYEKKLLKDIGGYDERLVRNQDIELNKRILNKGGKIFLVPNVYFTYYARENLKDFMKNNYSNGMWNVLTAKYTKNIKSLSLRHFIPLIFLLSLILPLLISIFYWKFIIISLLVLIVYLIVLSWVCIKIYDKDTTLIDLIMSFLALHFSYGVGSCVGILKSLKVK